MVEVIDNDAALNVPSGYKRLKFGGVAFNVLIGPIYLKLDGKDATLGFRVQQAHCNPAGMLHGGMMMTMADLASGFVVAFKAGIDKFMPTINMTFDFVAPARANDWIDCRGEVVRVTRAMAFATVSLHCGTEQLLRASCIMKIPSSDGPRFDRAKLLA